MTKLFYKGNEDQFTPKYKLSYYVLKGQKDIQTSVIDDFGIIIKIIGKEYSKIGITSLGECMGFIKDTLHTVVGQNRLDLFITKDKEILFEIGIAMSHAGESTSTTMTEDLYTLNKYELDNFVIDYNYRDSLIWSKFKSNIFTSARVIFPDNYGV